MLSKPPSGLYCIIATESSCCYKEIIIPLSESVSAGSRLGLRSLALIKGDQMGNAAQKYLIVCDIVLFIHWRMKASNIRSHAILHAAARVLPIPSCFILPY